MSQEKLRTTSSLGSTKLTHLGEGLDLATVAGSALSWEETQRAVTGSFVLLAQHLSQQNDASIP
jgi:hypothetical protein